MARNKKNDYFEMLTSQAEYCVRAAVLLENALAEFDFEKSTDIYREMHAIEHNGDILHHSILSKLSTEFITPIDQEDILRLVQIIDDVTDAIDEVTLDFYMYDIRVLPQGADEFARLVASCVRSLYAAVSELKNFKKPEKLRAHIVEMNNAETAADKVFTEAIHDLFTSCADAKTLIGGNRVLESLENCCDLCEHAADVIEQIIMKNT